MTERGCDEAWSAIRESFPSMVEYLDGTWYKVRSDWARYGIGLQFTAATTATSRSESSHAKLKRDGSSNQSLLEFKSQVDEFLASEVRSWNEELVRTKQGRGISSQEQETRRVFGGIISAIEPLVTATWMTMFLNRVRKSFGYQVPFILPAHYGFGSLLTLILLLGRSVHCRHARRPSLLMARSKRFAAHARLGSRAVVRLLQYRSATIWERYRIVAPWWAYLLMQARYHKWYAVQAHPRCHAHRFPVHVYFAHDSPALAAESTRGSYSHAPHAQSPCSPHRRPA